MYAIRSYYANNESISYEQIRGGGTNSGDQLPFEVDQAIRRRQRTEEIILSLSSLLA